ncbi:MAG: hypothetical protein KAT70_07095, partial [Thermoplasmata archaeon]|nr:hypothetical protein [Thermoplasmata archaeon]
LPRNEGDDARPHIFSFKEQLHVIWQTGDKGLGTGADDDLAISHYIPVNDTWGVPEEYTSVHDTGNDNYPFFTAYGDMGLVIWQTSDPSTSSGIDWDIVISTLDNVNISDLSSVLELTPAKDGMDDGSFYQRGFSAVEYQDVLYVFWQTQNPDLSEGTDPDIVYRCLFLPSDEIREEGGKESEQNDALILAIALGAAVFVATTLLTARATRHLRQGRKKKSNDEHGSSDMDKRE